MFIAMASSAMDRHIQSGNWDCGVACVQAVLRNFGAALDVREYLVGTSVWTPDLSWWLASAGIEHSFSTTYLGANPEHRDKAFYTGFDHDEFRLPALVARLRASGKVRLAEGHVPLEHILAQLEAQASLFIVLLDMRHMHCHVCGWRPGSPNGQYAGHYVVLTGYSRATGLVRYMDPDARAGCAQACSMTGEVLESARVEEGTDEDVIEVRLGQPSGGQDKAVTGSTGAQGS